MATELATIEERLEVEGLDALVLARRFIIVDAASAEEVAAHRRWCKDGETRVDTDLDGIRKSAHDAWKGIVAKIEQHKRPYREAEVWCGKLLAAWDGEQTRIRREAEAVQARERERLEAEERARVVAETARLRREEEDRRLEAALAAEARGDTATAQRIVTAPIVVEPVAPRPVFVPPVQVPEVTRPEGTSYQTRWTAELVSLTDLLGAANAGLIPMAVLQQVLMFNGPGANALARSTRGNVAVPGVKFVATRTTVQK